MSIAEPPVFQPGFERTPPNNIEAEQSVLGGMLLSKDAIADVVEILRSDDFYRPAHQIIYDIITDLYGRGDPADSVTLFDELQKRGEVARIGGGAYLHTLTAVVPTAANAGYYARIVREQAILRRLIEAGTRIVSYGYGGQDEEVDDLVDRAQAEIYKVTERRTSEDYVPLADIMPGALDELEAIGGRGGQMVGVPTGFQDLDALTNGLHPGQMIVVAARPAIGKALALDTPLPTPDGWTTMGEVRPGDRLIGADGRPTRVVAATGVLHGRPCYEVEFDDGTVIVADARHQWRTTSAPVTSAPATVAHPHVSAHRDASTHPNVSARRSTSTDRETVHRDVNAHRDVTAHQRVVTTEEIARTLHGAPAGGQVGHAVAVAAGFDLPERDLPLPPYALGVALGVGLGARLGATGKGRHGTAEATVDIGHTGAGHTGREDTGDAENATGEIGVVTGIENAPDADGDAAVVTGAGNATDATGATGATAPTGATGAGGGHGSWPAALDPEIVLNLETEGLRITGEGPDAADPPGTSGPHPVPVVPDLLGVLGVLGALGEERIPGTYLRASCEQRRALLAGLLDARGHVDHDGRVRLPITGDGLARDAFELVLSLGHLATMTAEVTEDGGDAPRVHHMIDFVAPEKVFRLSGKAVRQVTGADAATRVRNIVDVRPVPSTPVRCVEVDAADHMYLAGPTCVPTHNSTLGLDFARSAAIKHGMTTVVFSLEMSRNEITMRLLSAEARVALHAMRSGTMTDDDWAKLARRMGEVAEAPLFIDDSPNMSMMEIRAKCRRLKQRNDLRFVIIDYLQLMSSPKKTESRQNEVSEISRAIKLLAKELEVPVIAISQLNRGPEQRTDKRPMVSDLRESGSIEQDADMVILLHREDAYERESPRAGEADLIVAKHRNGPTATVTVAFQGHYSRFVDMAPH
ncbi:replicative DNA helicase [Streptosporangium sp. NPDC023615]|uniref:replicative DNA helicase n=1 Tax=Streptosporangium sp. NPDC023615 TaxID=3154794 RepID=UPI00342E2065